MLEDKNEVRLTIPFLTVFKVIVAFLLVYFAYLIRDLILVLIASVVIAAAIEPMVRWFQNRKFPRVLSVLLIYIMIFLVFAGIAYFFVPEFIRNVRDISGQLPSYVEYLSSVQPLKEIPGFESSIQNISQSTHYDYLVDQVGGFSGATFGFVSFASSIFGGLASLILILILSFYLAVQEDGVTSLLKIIVPIKHEAYVINLWKRSQQKIGLWMQGQLLLGLLVGILTYLGLVIFSVPNALILAVIAGIFELIPLFGPVLSSIPAISIGLIDGGITKGFLVAGLFLIVQQFENHLLHPLVVKKMVGMPALVAIIALIIGIKIAGFIGMLIAVPVAAIVLEYIGDIEKEKLSCRSPL